jgi:hypothetical protein
LLVSAVAPEREETSAVSGENSEVAVFAVDPETRGDYRSMFAEGNLVAAMDAVFRLPHPLGTLVFPRDSADPTTPTALRDVADRLIAALPAPAFPLVTYFSLAGDPAAGTPEIRDERRRAVRVATTTGDEVAVDPGAESVTSTSVEVEQEVFDVARGNGVMQSALMVVDPVPAPMIDSIDPDNGRPGDTFTVFGSGFVVDPGDTVSVAFAIPTEPDQPPSPGAFTIVGTPTATTIVAVVPEMRDEVEFPLIVSRRDGAETFSADTFSVHLL